MTNPAVTGDPNSQAWCRLAQDVRTALDLLGYDLPSCLPGEKNACGRPCADHAAAYLGSLRALVMERILRLDLEQAPAVLSGHRAADEALHGHRDTDPLTMRITASGDGLAARPPDSPA
jgi:hypothetical protein